MNVSAMLSNSLAAVVDVVADVEKAVAAGGGPVAEAISVAEALWGDADFKAKIVALVAAIKS